MDFYLGILNKLFHTAQLLRLSAVQLDHITLKQCQGMMLNDTNA